MKDHSDAEHGRSGMTAVPRELPPCPLCGSPARTVFDMQDNPAWAQCNNHGKKQKNDARCYLSHALVPIAQWSRRQAVPEDPVAPHIIEALSWHENERDDLTLEEAAEFIRHSWKKVHGRTERQLVLQIAHLLAAAPRGEQT